MHKRYTSPFIRGYPRRSRKFSRNPQISCGILRSSRTISLHDMLTRFFFLSDSRNRFRAGSFVRLKPEFHLDDEEPDDLRWYVRVEAILAYVCRHEESPVSILNSRKLRTSPDILRYPEIHHLNVCIIFRPMNSTIVSLSCRHIIVPILVWISSVGPGRYR
jgi:hypothetical protein